MTYLVADPASHLNTHGVQFFLLLSLTYNKPSFCVICCSPILDSQSHTTDIQNPKLNCLDITAFVMDVCIGYTTR